MSKWLAEKWGNGVSPRQFMDGMTKNKETFASWYEKFAWEDEETRGYFESLTFRDDLRCLILASDWCGDVVRNVPVVFRANETAGIPTEVFIMEQHLDLMDQYLTMGGRSIPIVLYTDTGGVELAKWGPRPRHVQAVMEAFKRDNPDRGASDYEEKLAAARQEIGRQYGEGTGYQQVIVRELRELLSRV